MGVRSAGLITRIFRACASVLALIPPKTVSYSASLMRQRYAHSESLKEELMYRMSRNRSRLAKGAIVNGFSRARTLASD
jgi:hypothetical protein